MGLLVRPPQEEEFRSALRMFVSLLQERPRMFFMSDHYVERVGVIAGFAAGHGARDFDLDFQEWVCENVVGSRTAVPWPFIIAKHSVPRLREVPDSDLHAWSMMTGQESEAATRSLLESLLRYAGAP